MHLLAQPRMLPWLAERLLALSLQLCALLVAQLVTQPDVLLVAQPKALLWLLVVAAQAWPRALLWLWLASLRVVLHWPKLLALLDDIVLWLLRQ